MFMSHWAVPSPWVMPSPRPCTCSALPPGFRLASTTLITALVMTWGAVLYLLHRPVPEILWLLGGLAVLAVAVAAAVTHGRLLPFSGTPQPGWGMS